MVLLVSGAVHPVCWPQGSPVCNANVMLVPWFSWSLSLCIIILSASSLHAGYSLSIFLPISLLCIVPNEIMRWVVVMVATAISGLFLFTNLRERISAAGPGK